VVSDHFRKWNSSEKRQIHGTITSQESDKKPYLSTDSRAVRSDPTAGMYSLVRSQIGRSLNLVVKLGCSVGGTSSLMTDAPIGTRI
jgi:hypothetical protein